MLGRMQEAIEDFSQAVRLDPEYADAYSNRALALLNLGLTQRAIGDLYQAIRFNPQDAVAIANRAVANSLLGNDAEVQQDIDRAVELGIDEAALRRQIEETKIQSVVAQPGNSFP